MTRFKIEVNRRTGKVILFMEAPCGFVPIIGWDSIDGVEEFALMLLKLHREIKGEKRKTEEISNSILRQAFGEEETGTYSQEL